MNFCRYFPYLCFIMNFDFLLKFLEQFDIDHASSRESSWIQHHNHNFCPLVYPCLLKLSYRIHLFRGMQLQIIAVHHQLSPSISLFETNLVKSLVSSSKILKQDSYILDVVFLRLDLKLF